MTMSYPPYAARGSDVDVRSLAGVMTKSKRCRLGSKPQQSGKTLGPAGRDPEPCKTRYAANTYMTVQRRVRQPKRSETAAEARAWPGTRSACANSLLSSRCLEVHSVSNAGSETTPLDPASEQQHTDPSGVLSADLCECLMQLKRKRTALRSRMRTALHGFMSACTAII